ncbi:MAG TPA: HAD family hydrolase [Ktedonobacterales bacterium]|nr:HAD family hydrolase [Ktedonobacterales bacterium]
MIWLRPGLERTGLFPAALAADVNGSVLDAALFDVDGVLIDVTGSYRLSVIAASEHIVRSVNGLTEAPGPLITDEDVAAFKRAGGFNSDWDLAQALAALWTARLREWRGKPEAEVPLTEWARRASEAAHEGCGGLQWLHEAVPESAIPPWDEARWIHDEFYWGAKLLREVYGREPRYAPDAPGVVVNEELLLAPNVLPALVRMGITRFGLITGRNGAEVAWVLRRLNEGSGLSEDDPTSEVGWFESTHGGSPFRGIVPSDVFTKPDPRALAHAVMSVEARGAVYVGDTADDLAVVLRYRSELRPQDTSLPPVLAVMIAEGPTADVYRERGADILLSHIRELPEALAALGAPVAPPTESD